MSNNADTRADLRADGLVDDVLGRVAEIAGAKNDAALARVLKVSPQTLSSWRKRSTVPYEAITRFAADQNISLDHLILGRGDTRVSKGAIDPTLFEAIAIEISEESKLRDVDQRSELRQEFAGTMLAYYTCLVYNRIERLKLSRAERFAFIGDEVKYLLDLKAKEHVDPIGNIYPEEALHLRSEGSSPEQVWRTSQKPVVNARKGRRSTGQLRKKKLLR